MYREKIVNTETATETFRDYTAEEIAEVESNIQLETIRQAEAEAKADEKEALLARLGITADEAKLLLS